MNPLLKKRYSILDVVPITLLITLVLVAGLYFFLTSSYSYSALFDEHRADDPRAATHMQQAFAEIVAKRDVNIPLEKQKEIAKLFHDLDIWKNMWFMGISIQKNPCDLWMMQQIIYETRPDYIVETGTFRGGSALYFAQVLEGLGLEHSKVITVDIETACQEAAKHPLWRKHVEFIEGSSTDPDVVARIAAKTKGKKVIVVLDSVHERDHVLKELRFYGPLVNTGSYLVVEDTNSDGVPIFPGSIGPTAAVQEFLASAEGKDFVQDASREAMVLTFNPGGWLKRIEAAVAAK